MMGSQYSTIESDRSEDLLVTDDDFLSKEDYLTKVNNTHRELMSYECEKLGINLAWDKVPHGPIDIHYKFCLSTPTVKVYLFEYRINEFFVYIQETECDTNQVTIGKLLYVIHWSMRVPIKKNMPNTFYLPASNDYKRALKTISLEGIGDFRVLSTKLCLGSLWDYNSEYIQTFAKPSY